MSDSLLEDVLSCPNLPSLPAVAVKLLELTSDPDVAMRDIAQLVQQDQALAAKVLKTVNSSFYGLSSRCGSIERAMGYLGLNTVKSLVLGFSLVDSAKQAGGDEFDLDAHWRRAIIGATGSRAVARIVGGIDPEEAFTAALFQDMGMLANFASMKTRYAQAIDGVPHRVLCSSEKNDFGFSHSDVGAALASKWKLPEEIGEAIRCHHHIEKASTQHQALARIVSLGADLTDAMDEKTAKSAIRKIERLSYQWYAKKAPQIEALLEEVAETSRVLAKMFEQDIGELPSASEMMAQAQEKTIEHQVSLQRQAEEMERSAFLDGLTGIANRKRFDAELNRVYIDFESDKTGFGILFFDADKFKNVNDTYGHAAGDAVLKELAKRTTDTINDAGIVCRYGGEEFAIILQNSTLDECAMLAEQVRSIIAGTPFDLSGVEGVPDELGVTVSIGVSSTCAGSPGRLASADQIVQEADECVYAAKDDGRNNVKVYGRLKGAKQTPVESKASSAQRAPAVSDSQPKPKPMPKQVGSPANRAGAAGKGVNKVGRIMLVEDDSLAATLVISLIRKRNKSIDIQWVKSGTKACVLLESGKFTGSQALDLILCDFNLPGCNGHEVLRVAKHGDGGVSHVPFFMLTGSTDSDIPEESYRLGAAKFIHKDEFCADVNKWLNQVLSPLPIAA